MVRNRQSSKAPWIVLIGGAFIVLVAIFMALNAQHSPDILFVEFFWNSIARALGLFIAAAAGATIFMMAFRTISYERCAVLAVAMLGGLLLATANSGNSIAIGLIVSCMLLQKRLATGTIDATSVSPAHAEDS